MNFNQICSFPGLQGFCSNSNWFGKYLDQFASQFPSNPILPQFPPTNPNNPGDTGCNAGKWNILIGSQYNPQTKQFTMTNGSKVSEGEIAGNYRVLAPNDITTMEYNSGRLNIYYDKPENRQGLGGTVTKVNCG